MKLLNTRSRVSFKQQTMVGRIALLAFACLSASAANAVVLYEQAVVGGGEGYYSNNEAFNQYADSFVLEADATIDSVSWWGSYFVDPTSSTVDSFNVRFFTGSDDPNATPFEDVANGSVSREVTALTDAFGSSIYRYNLDLDASLALVADQSYFLSISNEAEDENASGDSDSDWYWAFSEFADGSNWFRLEDGTEWDLLAEDYDLSFALNGESAAVPEPGSFGLLLIGLLAAQRRLRSSIS